MHILPIHLVFSLLCLLPAFYAAPTNPSSAAGRFIVGCWNEPGLPSPVPRDCYIAGHMLARTPNPSVMSTFTNRYSDTGVMVPISKVYESCAIIIDMAQPQTSDLSSWTEIGMTAMMLLMQCVEQGPRTGGRATAGENNMIWVAIAGRGKVGQEPQLLPYLSTLPSGSNRLVPHRMTLQENTTAEGKR